MAERRFLLNVPRALLGVGLALSVLYFIWLLLIAGRVVVIRRGQQFIDPVVWVWVGVGLFGLLLVLGFFAMIPSRSRRDEDPLPPPEAAIPSYAPPPPPGYAPAPSAPAAPLRRRDDVEIRVAPEDYKGKKVVEVSLPPKSSNRGAVYAKAYVPVDDAIVLRVEDLVADRRDVSA